MNKIIKTLTVSLLALFTLTGCREDSQEVTQNGNFEIELLFEQNGCKMYRFQDGARMIYWPDCSGKIQSDYITHPNNRTTVIHHEETITTE